MFRPRHLFPFLSPYLAPPAQQARPEHPAPRALQVPLEHLQETPL